MAADEHIPSDEGLDVPTGPHSGDVPQAQPPPSGRRQAFDDVLRPLTPEDLSSPGTQTIILHMLQEARAKADALSGYVERFNDADKRAAILQEQLSHERKTSKATEVAATSCTTLGGTIVGVALYFFRAQPDGIAGVVALVIGGLMIGMGLVMKVIKR
jgi:hypothetical protein